MDAFPNMRMPRISFPENTSVHHVIVRCVAGAFLLGDDEKEVLRKQLEKTAAFCGVEVLAYVFMSNHYHLLVRVPELGIGGSGWVGAGGDFRTDWGAVWAEGAEGVAGGVGLGESRGGFCCEGLAGAVSGADG
jgi:hypothetical protein